MRIKLNNYELEFKNKEGTWEAILLKDKLEISFCFNEAIFNNHQSIEWDLITEPGTKIIENLATLITKAENILIALHKEIFGNEYVEHEGYFELSYIEITNLNGQFDLVFYLFSKSNFVMDPYFHYKASFKIENDRITIIGVKRE